MRWIYAIGLLLTACSKKHSPDGTGVVQLTHFQQPFESGDTNWSADGKRITFEYDIDGHLQSDPDAAAWVWTMTADGQAQQSTTQPCSAVGCAPRWKPD